jgi:hypothetical protein
LIQQEIQREMRNEKGKQVRTKTSISIEKLNEIIGNLDAEDYINLSSGDVVSVKDLEEDTANTESSPNVKLSILDKAYQQNPTADPWESLNAKNKKEILKAAHLSKKRGGFLDERYVKIIKVIFGLTTIAASSIILLMVATRAARGVKKFTQVCKQ